MASWATYFRNAFTRSLPEDSIAGDRGQAGLWENLKPLLPAVMKHWRMWAISGLLLFLGSLLSFPQPLITRFLIDRVLTERQPALLPATLALWAAVALGAKAATVFRQFYVTRFDREVTISLQQDLLERTLRLPKAFSDSMQTGYLMSRFTNDVNGVRWFFSGVVFQLADQVLRLIGGACFLFYLEWRLALPVVIVLPACWFVVRYFGRRSYVMGHHQSEQHARITSRLQESLSSLPHIKAFATEDRSAGAIVGELRHAMTLALEQVALNVVNSNVISLMPGLARFATLAFGSYWILRDEWTIGSLLAFQMYLGYVFGPAVFLANINIQLQTARAALDRVAALHRLVPEDNVGTGEVVERLAGRVEFDGVSFSYDREPVLEDVTFAVEPGEKVAVVGHSGAGKTTLISLILRLYNPTAGEIRFDRRPASHYEVRSLRERIGYVAQATQLLSGTLMENLCYGNPGASEEEAIRAAQIAGLHDFIAALPAGYDTQVGENGVALSEGQKQRLSIARALVKDPDILILDEPTSNLDGQTEASIFEALPERMEGKTVFIVAHSLGAVLQASRILVLDGEGVAGSGTHEALLRTCRVYRVLFGEESSRET